LNDESFSEKKENVKILEDPLAHLPCSIIEEFRKGDIIYRQDEISTHLYLVIDGKVKLLRHSQNNPRPSLIDIYDVDSLFGESCLIELNHAESAIALEDTRVMTWTGEEIERIAVTGPKLALALIHLIVQRSADFESRIETLVVDTIDRRLAKALCRFSERFGSQPADGTVKMIPFTHELLGQYVGTSREIITAWMNHFRKQGYLQYSRRGMVIYTDALRDWLNPGPATQVVVRTAA
jgi:CRP/FNR family cyclic AMP-dependent transcriptional regulator